MLGEDQEKAFLAFVDQVRNNSLLDPQVTVLVFLAAAMALGCPRCIQRFAGMARQSGVSEEQIGAVASAAMAVAAGAVRNRCLEALAPDQG